RRTNAARYSKLPAASRSTTCELTPKPGPTSSPSVRSHIPRRPWTSASKSNPPDLIAEYQIPDFHHAREITSRLTGNNPQSAIRNPQSNHPSPAFHHSSFRHARLDQRSVEADDRRAGTHLRRG